METQKSPLRGEEMNLEKMTLQSLNLLEQQRAETLSDCNQFYRRKTQETHQKAQGNHKVTVTMEMCDQFEELKVLLILQCKCLASEVCGKQASVTQKKNVYRVSRE